MAKTYVVSALITVQAESSSDAWDLIHEGDGTIEHISWPMPRQEPRHVQA